MRVSPATLGSVDDPGFPWASPFHLTWGQAQRVQRWRDEFADDIAALKSSAFLNRCHGIGLTDNQVIQFIARNPLVRASAA